MTKPSLQPGASPDAYAAAMVQCQGYAPACSDAGECQSQARDCFTADGRGYKAAQEAIGELILATRCPHARSWLAIGRNAMEFQRSLERAET